MSLLAMDLGEGRGLVDSKISVVLVTTGEMSDIGGGNGTGTCDDVEGCAFDARTTGGT